MKGLTALSNVDRFLTGRKLQLEDEGGVAVQASSSKNVLEENLGTPCPYSMLAMARLFGRLRLLSGVWQMFVYELLELNGVDVVKIAKEVGVSPRTIKRILASNTQQPSIKTSFKLFFLHSRLRKERYTCNAQGEIELDLH